MIKLNKTGSYKIGLDEINGLEKAMTDVLKPVLEHIQDRVYWDNPLKFEPSEYLSRDGFIPHRSNCGGMELVVIVPKCEEHDFSFLGFGDCGYCEELAVKNELNSHGEIAACGYGGQECSSDSEGHLDAKLRVWLKLEPLDENGVMHFYLVLSGGNGDAPYFREKASSTYFESEFEAKSIAEFKRVAAKHIAKLIKVMK
jgi:hypothetical protein